MMSKDPFAQMRSLYLTLCEDQSRFDEFRALLARYQPCPEDSTESPDAAAVRDELNARIRAWIGAHFDGLSATQTLLWRHMLVDVRENAILSPWGASSGW
jgi:hypothetical protein